MKKVIIREPLGGRDWWKGEHGKTPTISGAKKLSGFRTSLSL